MNSALKHFLFRLAFFGFGLFNFFLYLAISIRTGSFFRKNTEQDKLQLAIARDKFWNLSKTVAGLSHRFFVLRNGLKLHYLTSNPNNPSSQTSKPLVIFLHGFPDSSVMWRHVIQSSSLEDRATLVALDLPGYGGSDSFEKYGPDEVLESLTEFIAAMREEYVDSVDTSQQSREQQDHGGHIYIVGHDWGCVLAYRLSAEAPCLADKFILTNGPLVPLAMSNKDRILNSSRKIFHTFLQDPVNHRSCLRKSFNTLRPLLFQLLLFGYIAAFHLPAFMVKYLGTGGNYAFLRGAQRAAYGKDKSDYSLAESMAATLGPSDNECKTETSEARPSSFGDTVLQRAKNPGSFFIHQTAYYRDGVSTRKWDKSLETIGALHNIAMENEASNNLSRRRTSSASSGLFEPPYAGSLRAPATIIWGQRDQACTEKICLEGIGDYLAKGSQVVLLPRSGHWTVVEKESRKVMGTVIEWYVAGGDLDGTGDVGKIVSEVYKGSTVPIRR